MDTSEPIEKVKKEGEEEFLPSQEILRENLKAVRRRKVPKLFTEYKCQTCKKVFSDKYSLKNHETTHDPDFPFQCEQCIYKCKNRKYLSRHVLKVHNKQRKKLACEICEKRFFFKCQLDKHFRVHSGEKPNKCDVCGKAFNSRYSLNTHKLIHTNEKPYKCSFCDYACRDSSSLRKHHSSHLGITKRYPCEQCLNRYNTKARLLAHILEKHKNEEPEMLPCHVCGAAFKKKWILATHVRTVHEKKMSCECGVCGKYISNRANLKAHLRVHIDARPYGCTHPGCGKRFKDNTTLKKHIIIHYPVKQMVCNECGRRFTRKHRLIKHLKRREASKDKACPNFYNNRKSKYFGPIRDGPKVEKVRMTCDTCGYRTTSRRKLVKHIQYGHGSLEDRECGICKKTFRKNDYLKVHYWNCHNVKYRSKIKTKPKPMVVIKEEPEDLISDIEFELLDIEKKEPFAEFEHNVSSILEETEALPEEERQEESKATESNQDINKIEINQDKDTIKNNQEDKQNEEELEGTQNDLATEQEETNMNEEQTGRPSMQVDEFIQHIILAEESEEEIEKEDTEKYVQKCIEELMQKSIEKNGFGPKKNIFGRKLKKIEVSEASELLQKLTQIRERDVVEEYTGEPRSSKQNRSVSSKTTDRNRRRIKKGKNRGQCTRKSSKRNPDNDNTKEEDSNTDSVASEKDGNTEKTQKTGNVKLIFNMHQCYVCFKLFKTKPELISHCQEHFDVCNEVTLKKCPFCPFVTQRDIKRHVRLIHKTHIDFSFMRIRDKKTNNGGSRYYFDIRDDNIKQMEIVPSIKILNKKASMDLDRKNRELKNKSVLKRKLIKKGKEWIVAHEKVDVSNRIVPEVKDTTNYLASLKQLHLESKKKGTQILFPCNVCDKVCQNLSALTLHLRIHDPNAKPFKPKTWKHKTGAQNPSKHEAVEKAAEVNTDNRTAKPKPIVTRHRCDPKLKDFYEKNIKGGDIEFWQFLKIYNKMSRENVNDFSDLENRTEFGIHYNNENNNAEEERINKDVEHSGRNRDEIISHTTEASSVTSKKTSREKPDKIKYRAYKQQLLKKRSQVQARLRESIANKC